MFKDLYSSAIALYDGGWRAVDRAQLITEYNLTKSEADQLCDALKSIEDRLSQKKD